MMRISSFTFENFDGGVPPRAVVASVLPMKAPKLTATQQQEAAPPPPPAITANDVEQARREGYQKGFEQGAGEEHRKLDQEQQTLEKAKLAVWQSVASGLSEMSKEYMKGLDKSSQLLPEMVLSIAKKVVGYEIRQISPEALTPMIQSCLMKLMDEPQVVVYVHFDLIEDMESELEQLKQQEGFAGRLELKADERLAPEDCRIEWKNGMMERNMGQMLAQVEALFRQYGDMITGETALETYARLKHTIE